MTYSYVLSFQTNDKDCDNKQQLYKDSENDANIICFEV